jgi:hemolysin III
MDDGERLNCVTHAAGACLAAAGGTVLITVAAHGGDPWKITSFSIYAAMLLALYVTSTLYHGVRGQAKYVLRKMDHCAIYLLIAGTYTPFALVTLHGALGWWMLGAIWSLALLGNCGMPKVRVSCRLPFTSRWAGLRRSPSCR